MNRTGISAMKEKLSVYVEKLEEGVMKKQEALDNAESAEYPNEGRITKLNEEIDIFEGLKDVLEDAISQCDDYLNM